MQLALEQNHPRLITGAILVCYLAIWFFCCLHSGRQLSTLSVACDMCLNIITWIPRPAPCPTMFKNGVASFLRYQCHINKSSCFKVFRVVICIALNTLSVSSCPYMMQPYDAPHLPAAASERLPWLHLYVQGSSRITILQCLVPSSKDHTMILPSSLPLATSLLSLLKATVFTLPAIKHTLDAVQHQHE